MKPSNYEKKNKQTNSNYNNKNKKQQQTTTTPRHELKTAIPTTKTTP